MNGIKYTIAVFIVLILLSACGASNSKRSTIPILTSSGTSNKDNSDLSSESDNEFLNLNTSTTTSTSSTTSNQNVPTSTDIALNSGTPPVSNQAVVVQPTVIYQQVYQLPQRVVFDNSGNFIVPEGARNFRVTVVGGGGGGAGVVNHPTTELGGGGGGGAEVKIMNISISAGVTSIPIFVGKGGRGGIPPTDGEKSSFGSYVEAQGGKAPKATSWGGTTQYYLGGLAGGPGGSAGANGYGAASSLNMHKPGGIGGACTLGTGGPSIMPYQDISTVGPAGYGGGGGGGDSRNVGGGGTVNGLGDDGGNGVVIVEY